MAGPPHSAPSSPPHSGQLPLDLGAPDRAPKPRRRPRPVDGYQLGLLADVDPLGQDIARGRLMTPEKLQRRFWRPPPPRPAGHWQSAAPTTIATPDCRTARHGGERQAGEDRLLTATDLLQRFGQPHAMWREQWLTARDLAHRYTRH